MKRIFDVLFSMVLIIILGVPMLVIGLIIRISMGTPVFFKQVRPGYLGKPFKIMKFRTMSEARDSDGKVFEDRERLTKIGRTLRKYSLDELPQLFNVFAGDLSFVGPRPLLTEYLSYYDEHQARRHDVKPGITGWTQVNGRNALTWEEKFDLDIWYVDHRSFFLDMKILWLTVIKVFKKEGITAEGSATMPKFTGSKRTGNFP